MRGLLIIKDSLFAFHDATEFVNPLLRNLFSETAYDGENKGIGEYTNGADVDGLLQGVGESAQRGCSIFAQKDVTKWTEHEDDQDTETDAGDCSLARTFVDEQRVDGERKQLAGESDG